ncbi:MAG TPA: hypothetical protein P5137_05320, partial [Candidatus Brocadiia bacterium]|nr:hypothetical protein [Candidatus Brocadiia bacterium]
RMPGTEQLLGEALRRGAAQTKAKDESTAKAGGEEAPTAEAKGGAARRRGPGQRLIRGALERGEQIPPDVARFTTFRIEPPLAWEVFQEIGAVFAPKETQAAAARLQEVAKRAGARDAAELLGLLGKRAVVFTRYVKPYQNADAEQTVCVFEAADRNACDQRLAALRQNWPEAFGDKRVAEGDYFVYGCRLNGEELFYCLSESHLIVANNARAALDYIRFAGFDMSALAAQDAFALAMAKLPPQEQRVFATYHNPAPEFLYRTDRMRSNILDPAVEHAVRATPLASLFVTAVKGLRNTQALALLLPVSASALASTPSEITFTSYHAGP